MFHASVANATTPMVSVQAGPLRPGRLEKRDQAKASKPATTATTTTAAAASERTQAKGVSSCCC